MKRLLVAMADILQTSSSISAYELTASGLADNLLVFLTHIDSEASVSTTADLKVGFFPLLYPVLYTFVDLS
jgi:hypothetical protein